MLRRRSRNAVSLGEPDGLGNVITLYRLLLAASHILDRHFTPRAFIVTDNRDETNPPSRSIFELFAHLIRFGIEIDAETGAS